MAKIIYHPSYVAGELRQRIRESKQESQKARKKKTKMTYEEDYAYHIFLYGDLFKNILHSLRTQKDRKFHIPERYEEVTMKTVAFYNKWEKK
jgi:hypothetical protein